MNISITISEGQNDQQFDCLDKNSSYSKKATHSYCDHVWNIILNSNELIENPRLEAMRQSYQRLQSTQDRNTYDQEKK